MIKLKSGSKVALVALSNALSLQMKEKIFIAWSGTTAIAEEVEKLLNRSDYMAIIGGDHTVKPDSMFVGQSIINQIKKCSQAIFIITINKCL